MVPSEIIFEVKDSPEGGLEARALRFSIFTESENYENLKVKIKEAIHCHFENEKPKLIRIHYVREEIFAA